MAITDPQFKLRLPSDAKAFIEAEAKANASSQTSEVVRAIRERMKTTAYNPEAADDAS
ncbi:Arc family DNA-binding protein [Mesorhizobium sp. M0895]|uniref:Arc family DNA-binding protein n=1 Tax=Mesorhizobium sp. M0895 TaxID=2957019 RepID=UPI00333A7813